MTSITSITLSNEGESGESTAQQTQTLYPEIEPDQREFQTTLQIVQNLPVGTMRYINGLIRQGADKNTLIPSLGLTLGVISCYLIFSDKAQ